MQCYMKVRVVSDSIGLTSKMLQGKLESIDQNEDSGNAVLSIENAYCNIEKAALRTSEKL